MNYENTANEMAKKLMEYNRDFSDSTKEIFEETKALTNLFKKLQESEEFEPLVHHLDTMFMHDTFSISENPLERTMRILDEMNYPYNEYCAMWIVHNWKEEHYDCWEEMEINEDDIKTYWFDFISEKVFTETFINRRFIGVSNGSSMAGTMIIYETDAPATELKELEEKTNRINMDENSYEDVSNWFEPLKSKGYVFNYVAEHDHVSPYGTSKMWLENIYSDIQELYYIENQ